MQKKLIAKNAIKALLSAVYVQRNVLVEAAGTRWNRCDWDSEFPLELKTRSQLGTYNVGVKFRAKPELH